MAEETLERPEDVGKKAASQVSFWLDELELSSKREEGWRKSSAEVVEIYEAEKKATHQFNILYSNTETLSPAIYNTTPRPAIRRRYNKKDPLGLLAAKIANKIVEYHLDTNKEGFEDSFHEMMEQTLHEALLVGRGIPWLGMKSGVITMDCVAWDTFRQSYAKRKKDIWWIARWHAMTRDELVDNFGPIGEKVPVSSAEEDSDNTFQDDNENKGSLKTALVWEIWDKRTKKVHFVSPNYKEGFLRQVDDPLNLSSFFPCPQQLLWLRKVGCMTPVAPYDLYVRQAEELNAVTLRIAKIIRVMKVRGAYDASVDGLEKIFELEDGQLSPVENVAALQGGQGKLDSALWLMPIEKLVTVLQQLYAQREQIKQVIFEITGLADIIRGSSKASETLGAQQIKERWGGLRIRKMQGMVQFLVRALIRSIVELAADKIPVEELQKMTGVEASTAQIKAQAAQLANQHTTTGKPVPPQLQAVLSAPTFEEAVQLLRDDLQRGFRVDIETNSTVDVEATEDQQIIGEFMQATGQFISGISPLVVQGIMPFSAAQQILLSISRRLRFGEEVEEELMQMQAPQDSGQKAEAEKMQLEKEKAAGEMALKQKELLIKEQELKLREFEITLEKERVLLEREQTTLERERVVLETLKVQNEVAGQEKDRNLEREKLQQDWNDRAEDRKFKLQESVADREAGLQQAGAPQKIGELQKKAEEVSTSLDAIQQAILEVAGTVVEMQKPKGRKIERDAAGKALMVDGMPVQRDEQGRLLGWG